MESGGSIAAGPVLIYKTRFQLTGKMVVVEHLRVAYRDLALRQSGSGPSYTLAFDKFSDYRVWGKSSSLSDVRRKHVAQKCYNSACLGLLWIVVEGCLSGGRIHLEECWPAI